MGHPSAVIATKLVVDNTTVLLEPYLVSSVHTSNMSTQRLLPQDASLGVHPLGQRLVREETTKPHELEETQTRRNSPLPSMRHDVRRSGNLPPRSALRSKPQNGHARERMRGSRKHNETWSFEQLDAPVPPHNAHDKVGVLLSLVSGNVGSWLPDTPPPERVTLFTAPCRSLHTNGDVPFTRIDPCRNRGLELSSD